MLPEPKRKSYRLPAIPSWGVDDLSVFEKRECANFLLDTIVGYGTHRTVYGSALLPDCVLKFELGDRFANVIEWEVWNAVKETEFSRWFAPCVSISPNGLILAQKKTEKAYTYPTEIPAFFTDIKGENFGMLDGRFVCHDYANNLLMENGMTKKMRKVNWDSESVR